MLIAPSCYLCSSQALRRPFNYAIVDEVDSLLIDEGRNPMLITLTQKLESKRFKIASEVGATFARLTALL